MTRRGSMIAVVMLVTIAPGCGDDGRGAPTRGCQCRIMDGANIVVIQCGTAGCVSGRGLTCVTAGTVVDNPSACGGMDGGSPPGCGSRVCGPDRAGGSCGTCPAGQSCTPTGQCTADVCSPASPTGTCPAGQTCVSGACCAEPCAGSCCSSGSICVRDRSGNQICARECTTSRECSGAESCCTPLMDGMGAPLPYGACVVPDVGGASQCRCTSGSECASGYCAPSLNASSNPVQPYVCVRDSCNPYTGCGGFGVCPTGYCDLCDSQGNCFCAQSCTNDSMCGVARCIDYASINGSCGSRRACAPR